MAIKKSTRRAKDSIDAVRKRKAKPKKHPPRRSKKATHTRSRPQRRAATPPPQPVKVYFEDSLEDDRKLEVQLFYGVLLPFGFSYSDEGHYDDLEEDVAPYECSIGDFGTLPSDQHFLYIDDTYQQASHDAAVALGLPERGRDWDERLERWQRRLGLEPERGQWMLLVSEQVG